jgi:hypothetical protein
VSEEGVARALHLSAIVVHNVGVVVGDWSIVLTTNIEALGRVDSIVGMTGTLTAPAPVLCGYEGEEGDQKEKGD